MFRARAAARMTLQAAGEQCSKHGSLFAINLFRRRDGVYHGSARPCFDVHGVLEYF